MTDLERAVRQRDRPVLAGTGLSEWPAAVDLFCWKTHLPGTRDFTGECKSGRNSAV